MASWTRKRKLVTPVNRSTFRLRRFWDTDESCFQIVLISSWKRRLGMHYEGCRLFRVSELTSTHDKAAPPPPPVLFYSRERLETTKCLMFYKYQVTLTVSRLLSGCAYIYPLINLFWAIETPVDANSIWNVPYTPCRTKHRSHLHPCRHPLSFAPVPQLPLFIWQIRYWCRAYWRGWNIRGRQHTVTSQPESARRWRQVSLLKARMECIVPLLMRNRFITYPAGNGDELDSRWRIPHWPQYIFVVVEYTWV